MNIYKTAAAALIFSATAAFAQGMAAPKDTMAAPAKTDGMTAPKDSMAMGKPMAHTKKHDSMKHDSMKHDSMKSDTMAAPAH
jgi:pentapeptide MXKDX repeat protein